MKNTNLNHNVLIIRAHGIGFIFLVCLCLLFIIPALILIVCFFIPSSEIYNNWIDLLISASAFLYFSYELITLFKKSKVVFRDQIFECEGKYSRSFSSINKPCYLFDSYKFSSKLAAQCIEFTFSDGHKVLFHTMQFSKKQNLTILQEIKKRGGFKNQEIKIEHFYI